jgi:glycosyltransferase involved in cell wall biosynthesis
VIWHKLRTGALPTQLLKSIAFAAAASLALGVSRQRRSVLIGNGFSFVQRSDLNAVHFLHGSWLRSPYHQSRTRKLPASLYYWLFDALFAVLERIAIRRARHVVAVSTVVKQELEALNYRRSEITVIPNGVSCKEFTDGPPSRERFGLPTDKVVGLFAGDLRSGRKNLDTVLHALPAVPDMLLAVAGYTSRSPYPALVRRMGLECRVCFLDYQADMPALIRSADFVIFPSHYDPFGLVALEACASGRPVIISRAAGASVFLDDGCAFKLDRADDVDALSAAMTKLVTSPDLRARMGAIGRHTALKYDWSDIVGYYLGLIETIAALKSIAA